MNWRGINTADTKLTAAAVPRRVNSTFAQSGEVLRRLRGMEPWAGGLRVIPSGRRKMCNDADLDGIVLLDLRISAARAYGNLLTNGKMYRHSPLPCRQTPIAPPSAAMRALLWFVGVAEALHHTVHSAPSFRATAVDMNNPSSTVCTASIVCLKSSTVGRVCTSGWF